MSIQVVEKDEAGSVYSTTLHFRSSDLVQRSRRRDAETAKKLGRLPFSQAFSKLFLPDGYPHSVSSGLISKLSDYTRYQVYNCIQALCSSIAGLISSRAILEGAGVGDASASATNALLVTILQDACSRLATIVGAYYIGTSLFPEAKTYRFLADILNDSAITLDALSPIFNTILAPGGFFLPGSIRVFALCISGSLRSLCGIAAGGSKSALAVHFSSSTTGTCDLGDLNAKDSSRETVVSLVGMLVGTLMIPYLTTRQSSYTVLFFLLSTHLLANYLAVRSVVLRSLNRQRVGIAWSAYRLSHHSTVPPPHDVSEAERTFEFPGTLRDARSGKSIGMCTVGSSPRAVLHHCLPVDVLDTFRSEKYILGFDSSCLHYSPSSSEPKCHVHIRGFLRLHVFLKEGHSTVDHLKAWLHAAEVAQMLSHRGRKATRPSEVAGRSSSRGEIDGEDDKSPPESDEASEIISESYWIVERQFAAFVDKMREAGWCVDEGGIHILTGSPKAVVISVRVGQDEDPYLPVEVRKGE